MSDETRALKILWVAPQVVNDKREASLPSSSALLIQELVKLGVAIDLVTFITKGSPEISPASISHLGIKNILNFSRGRLPRTLFSRACLCIGQALMIPKVPVEYLPYFNKRIMNSFEALFDGRIRKLRELKVTGEYGEIIPDWDLILYDGLEGSCHLFDGKRMTLSPNVPPVFYRAESVQAQRWRVAARRSSGTLYANYYATQAELVKEFELALLRKTIGVLSGSQRAASQFRESLPRIRQTVVPPAITFPEDTPPRNPIPGRFLCIESFRGQIDSDALTWLLAEVWPEVVERSPDSELVLVANPSVKKIASRVKGLSRVTFCHQEALQEGEFLRCEALILPSREYSSVEQQIFQAAAFGCPIMSTPEAMDGSELKAGEHYEQLDSLNSWISRLAQQETPEVERIGRNLFNALSERHKPESAAQKLVDGVLSCLELEKGEQSRGVG